MIRTNAFKNQIFEYLDSLRESGVTNMFGAAPYVEQTFDVDKTEARGLLTEWMKTFADRHPRK